MRNIFWFSGKWTVWKSLHFCEYYNSCTSITPDFGVVNLADFGSAGLAWLKFRGTAAFVPAGFYGTGENFNRKSNHSTTWSLKTTPIQPTTSSYTTQRTQKSQYFAHAMKGKLSWIVFLLVRLGRLAWIQTLFALQYALGAGQFTWLFSCFYWDHGISFVANFVRVDADSSVHLIRASIWILRTSMCLRQQEHVAFTPYPVL